MGFCAIGDVFLQRTSHTDLPRVDVFALQLEAINKADNVVQRHTVAEHTGNQLGIVPILFVELLRETLNGGLVATLVFKLEVVTLCAVRTRHLDDASLRNGLRQGDALVIILQTSEDFIRMAVEQTDIGYPLFLVVLETNDIALQHIGTALRYFGSLANGNVGRGCFLAFLLVLLFLHAKHHA